MVEFSHTRRGYERQGILVTEAAIRQAEEECAADAPERARQRELAAVARAGEDVAFVELMKAKIRARVSVRGGELPRRAYRRTRQRTRVGRSAAGRKPDTDAVTLAVIAAVRHRRTRYDQLLARDIERADARAEVRGQIDEILSAWRMGHLTRFTV